MPSTANTKALSGALIGLSLLLIGAMAGADIGTLASSGPDGDGTVRFVVGFEGRPSGAVLDAVLAAGASTVIPVSTIDAAVVVGPGSLADAIARWPNVAYVDPVGTASFENYQTEAQTGEGALQRGDPPLPQAFTGDGVTIALVDLGVDDDHPDLAGQVIDRFHFDTVWALEGLVDEETLDLWVATSPGATRKFATSHGLLTAGIIAGTGANDPDMEGVAPGARIVDYNTCCASAYVSLVDEVAGIGFPPTREASGADIVLAYDHMIRHKDDYPGGIRIASNSWAVDQPENALKAILREAVANGIVVVNSAGNAGPGEDTVSGGTIKKGVEEIVLVAASCPAIDGYDLSTGEPCGLGDVATYSSRGAAVDIAAPGAGLWAPNVITSQSVPSQLPEPTELPYQYSQFGGTSAAQAYAVGVVALMLEANPSLTPAEVQQVLQDTAQDFGAPGFDTAWGWGEVRALAAVEAALAAGGPP